MKVSELDKPPDPRTHVRVTLRMQWDMTIASFETFIPHDLVQTGDVEDLMVAYVPALWGHTLAELKDRSVLRMLQGNGIDD